jgi:hypothetical protein
MIFLRGDFAELLEGGVAVVYDFPGKDVGSDSLGLSSRNQRYRGWPCRRSIAHPLIQAEPECLLPFGLSSKLAFNKPTHSRPSNENFSEPALRPQQTRQVFS